MSFTPKKFDSGKVILKGLTGSATCTKYAVMKDSSGYLAAGAAGDNEVNYIGLETTTDTTAVSGSTQVKVLPVDETIEFVALCATTPVQATHVGNDYDLGAAGYLDLTATTDKVFHIDSIVDATKKLVKGHFNRPALA